MPPPRWFKNVEFGRDVTNHQFQDIIDQFKSDFQQKLGNFTFSSTLPSDAPPEEPQDIEPSGPIIEELMSENEAEEERIFSIGLNNVSTIHKSITSPTVPDEVVSEDDVEDERDFTIGPINISTLGRSRRSPIVPEELMSEGEAEDERDFSMGPINISTLGKSSRSLTVPEEFLSDGEDGDEHDSSIGPINISTLGKTIRSPTFREELVSEGEPGDKRETSIAPTNISTLHRSIRSAIVPEELMLDDGAEDERVSSIGPKNISTTRRSIRSSIVPDELISEGEPKDGRVSSISPINMTDFEQLPACSPASPFIPPPTAPVAIARSRPSNSIPKSRSNRVEVDVSKCRRSKRTRHRPVEYARGERLIYNINGDLIGHDPGFPARYDYGRKNDKQVKKKKFIPTNCRQVDPPIWKPAKKGNYRFYCKPLGDSIQGGIELPVGERKSEAKTTPNQMYSFWVAKGQVILKMTDLKTTESIFLDSNDKNWFELPLGMRYSLKNCGTSQAVIAWVLTEAP